MKRRERCSPGLPEPSVVTFDVSGDALILGSISSLPFQWHGLPVILGAINTEVLRWFPDQRAAGKRPRISMLIGDEHWVVSAGDQRARNRIARNRSRFRELLLPFQIVATLVDCWSLGAWVRMTHQCIATELDPVDGRWPKFRYLLLHSKP